MKLSSRGFTLVELMIVIAIIGILAAALFPSMTGYLKRSRDSARAAGMKDIATALGAYYADNEKYLSGAAITPTAGCMNSGALNTSYMPKGVPQDPQSGWTNYTCTRMYRYGSSIPSANPEFVLAAIFENVNGGNYNGAASGFETVAGTLSGSAQAIQGMTSKGAGSGYIMTN